MPDAAYIWYRGPLAVRHVGTRDKTYFGGVSHDGDLVVASLDHETGEAVSNTVATVQADDHDNPGLLVRPDGHIVVGYTEHIGGQPTIHISSKP